MDPPSAEGKLCDSSSHPVKPHIVEWYNQHMDYVNISDHIANSYSMSRPTFKWTMKLFFQLLDLIVLNSWILLSSCGANLPTEISGSLWWGIWFRKLERAKITPPLHWLEDQVQVQKMFCDSRVAITNAGQWNHQPNCTAVYVLLAAKQRVQCISAPDVMWACVWCLVSQNITQK